MTGQPGERDGLDLIRSTARRLERSLRQEVPVCDVLVAMAYRCVFVTARPDGSPVVVKTDMRPGRTSAERRVMAAVRAAGVPVPAVVHADNAEPAMLVLEYVPGAALSSAAPASAWAAAGRVLRRLHDMPDPGGIGPAIERPAGGHPRVRPGLREAMAKRAGREAEAAVQRGLVSAGEALRIGRMLGEAFGGMEDPDACCVLHGDCQPSHFVLSRAEAGAGLGPAVQGACDGVAAVLDFGDACTGDPVWDLAVLTLDDPGRLGDVLTGYAPDPRLARRVSALAGPYRLLRRLGEASWLQDHGFNPEPSVAPLRDAAAAAGYGPPGLGYGPAGLG